MDGFRIQVDATPEFRLQCLREDLRWIDLFVLTHEHADHVAGLDDLRRFCDFSGEKAIDLYSTPSAIERIKVMYPYAIREKPVSKGYVAILPHPMPRRMELPCGSLESTLLPHGDMQTLGLVFTEKSSGVRFAYYTDCKTVPPKAVELARNADVVVLDGLRPTTHPTHMSIPEAIQMAGLIGGKTTYLTHLTHNVEHSRVEKELPQGIHLSYDGLKLELGDRRDPSAL
jgi:phosphoribosyl 1,2-cyclic phosphate phosphodiesterase